MAAADGHVIDANPEQQAYDVCERCGKPIQLDHLTGQLRTMIGWNAECYGGRHPGVGTMITIDQARIDAPDFPRSPEWWQRFLPDWITVSHRDGGIVVLDVTGVAHPSQGPRPAALVRRNQYEGFLRWLHNLPQLEAAIVEDAGERCQCWRQPAGLHDRHCCFMHDRICHSMPEDMRQAGTAIPA